MRRKLFLIVFFLLQFTWCLPQNLVGVCVFLKYRKCEHIKFFNSITTIIPRYGSSVSLGMFTFVSTCNNDPNWLNHVKCHEYGHTIQSLLLGPFYLFVVGIPSGIWCNFFEGYRKRNNVPYSKLFCESWANKLGAKYTGIQHTDMDRPSGDK